MSSCTDKFEPKIAKPATDTWPSEQALPPFCKSLKNVNSDEDKAPPSCANVRTETILPNGTTPLADIELKKLPCAPIETEALT